MNDNYFYNRNPDIVFIRSFIIAVRNFLTEKIVLKNYFQNKVDEHPIKFFYDTGGDERFLQDLFVSSLFEDRIQQKPVEGNIDVIPRGMFKIDSIAVNAAELTNRFVRGKKIIMDEQGVLKTQYSNMNILPLTASISVEIILSRKIEVFKVWQEVIKTFYKLAVIEFMFENQYIRCQLGFPEELSQEMVSEFSYGDSNTHKITFNIESSLYFPVFDDEYFNVNKSDAITKFDINFHVGKEGETEGVLYEEIIDVNSKEELSSWFKSRFNSSEIDVTTNGLSGTNGTAGSNIGPIGIFINNNDTNNQTQNNILDDLQQDYYEQNYITAPKNTDDNLHFTDNFGEFNYKLNHTLVLHLNKPVFY